MASKRTAGPTAAFAVIASIQNAVVIGIGTVRRLIILFGRLVGADIAKARMAGMNLRPELFESARRIGV
ncbi:hypothetical protein FHX06_002535 [Rhizobium sp. BK512]|uniref:hypothetical protein n=1 Tax=Rhizobium sp. BK512 TaxID=2587010 RepID=UPI000DDD6289|nr:hypothetical protein [Rhizobium sp. BK512]MBB3561208.1 hypothetical protein [Rhizobium sp. BK512]